MRTRTPWSGRVSCVAAAFALAVPLMQMQSANAQAVTQQAPPSALLLERKGSLGPFSLGERASQYGQYLEPVQGQVGAYLSSDSLFVVRVDATGQIVAVESSASGVLTTRLIRPGVSSMRHVLDAYGAPQRVRVDQSGLVLVYDRVEFGFAVHPDSPLTDTEFEGLLQTKVNVIRLVG